VTHDSHAATTDAQTLVQSYLDAFAARDLARCLDFYTEGAEVKFVSGVYAGRAALEEWHKERFAADLQVLRVDSVSVDRDTVKIDLMLASNRLKFFRINSLAARATVRLDGGRIREAHFGPRFTDPFEGW